MKKILIVVLIWALLILCGFVLALLTPKPASAAPPLYEFQCGPEDFFEYERDAAETIQVGSGVIYRVCYDFQNVREETDVDTLVVKVGKRAQWQEFENSAALIVTRDGLEQVFTLALQREFSGYQQLPLYHEEGIMVYYTISAGHYAFRWYVLDPDFECATTAEMNVQVGPSVYPLCAGVLLTKQTEDRFTVMVISDFAWSELDATRSAIFRNALGDHPLKTMLRFQEKRSGLTEEERLAFTVNEGMYFWRETQPDRFDVLWYQGTGRGWQLFLPFLGNN